MQLLLPHTRGMLPSRPRAFRQDASSVLTGVSPHRQPAADTTPRPLWKKPSFPFVALIALTTLPFDLTAACQSSAPPRHAKPTPAVTARPAPTQDIAAVKQQAAVAAAAAGQGSSSAVSSPPPAAAAGAGAGPAVDSWDAAGGDVSDEDAEQQAKAMVIVLLTHPKDTEAALMRAAAAGKGGGDGGAEGAGLSVSPEYIDALVEAAREPTMGMPHREQPAAKADTQSRPAGTRQWSSSSSSSNTSSQEEF